MKLFDILDLTSTRNGVFRMGRIGNGYKWEVFAHGNTETPLFEGQAGSFFEAQRLGLDCLKKSLEQIFWILNQCSQKERREGESVDSELIEQAIRAINSGSRDMALVALDKVIARERAEREPEDVERLQLARTLLLGEKEIGKGDTPLTPVGKEWPEIRQTEGGEAPLEPPTHKTLEDDFGADRFGHEYYEGDKHRYRCKLCGAHEDSPNAQAPCRKAHKSLGRDLILALGKGSAPLNPPDEKTRGGKVCELCGKVAMTGKRTSNGVWVGRECYGEYKREYGGKL